MTGYYLKEETTEKREIPQVALSLYGEKSSLGFIVAVRQW